MSDLKACYSVVIADDHDIIRGAIADALSQKPLGAEISFNLLDVATNGLEAIASVKAHKPDILFLDISMPLASGAEIVHEIKRWSPVSKIIVFTGINAPGLISGIVQSGVAGIFSKSSSVSAIFQQLPALLNGSGYVDPEFVALIKNSQQALSITDRERQVLNMLVAGRSNKEIAELLSISPKTVDKHRTSLMSKLDVHSIAQLMARALKDGLIESF